MKTSRSIAGKGDHRKRSEVKVGQMFKFGEFRLSYDAFKRSGSADPLREALQLFNILSDGKMHDMLASLDLETVDLEAIIARRRDGIPLEYILGRAVFMGKSFYCTKDTLIPRPETSLLVQTAAEFMARKNGCNPHGSTIIEIGTGCGNIAVSLALICDDGVKILASDISPSAVEVARRNVHKFNLQEKVQLYCGDLYEPFHEHRGKVDVVICNPPYIPTTSLKKLAREIIDHEPVVALDGGPYGLNIFKRLINEAPSFLDDEGMLVFEIGEGQEKLIERLLERSGAYKDIEFFKYEGKVRAVSAIKK